MPKVSVIMGIYNCQDTLKEAVDSIVQQTFLDWELLLCDDGSTDHTFSLAQDLQKQDPRRILLIKNKKNMGLNYTLNRCLGVATGQYIARMDADDVSLTERFDTQVAYLDAHQDMSIVSAGMVLFDESGTWGRIVYPAKPSSRDMMLRTPFAHAPSMVRAEALRAVGGYSEDKRLLRVEDYHLWYKMYKAGYRGCNLQTVLYRCRDDRAAQGRRKFRYRINETYVKWLVFRDLAPGWSTFPYLLRPILTGLMPRGLYNKLHKHQLRGQDQDA